MRKMRFEGDGGGIPDPSGQGPGIVGPFDCPVALEPPPGAPIRTAWVAGRLGIAFDGGREDILGHLPALSAVPTMGHPLALAVIRDLDVNDRPYIWDLPED